VTVMELFLTGHFMQQVDSRQTQFWLVVCVVGHCCEQVQGNSMHMGVYVSIANTAITRWRLVSIANTAITRWRLGVRMPLCNPCFLFAGLVCIHSPFLSASRLKGSEGLAALGVWCVHPGGVP